MHAGGIDLRVRLTPKSAREEIGEIVANADGVAFVAARVRKPPEKGAANKALEKLVATWIGLPRSHVRVTAGLTSRLKTVTILGEPETVANLVARRLARR